MSARTKVAPGTVLATMRLCAYGVAHADGTFHSETMEIVERAHPCAAPARKPTLEALLQGAANATSNDVITFDQRWGTKTEVYRDKEGRRVEHISWPGGADINIGMPPGDRVEVVPFSQTLLVALVGSGIASSQPTGSFLRITSAFTPELFEIVEDVKVEVLA